MATVPLFKVFLAPEERLIPRLRDVLYSGQISIGPPVTEFERRFGDFLRIPNPVALSSGTAALHLALILAGVTDGDEVISTALTAEPTNVAIRQAGGSIVWADIDPRNGNLDPRSVEKKVGPRTKAILVVHYGGIPADVAALRQIADRHGLKLIEDSAHALGARFAGKHVGALADYAIYSLQAIKHMTTIDGGILCCRAEEDARRAKVLRWFGMDRDAVRTQVDITELGYKYNMNNVTATLGIVQLEFIEGVIARHVENGRYFDAALAGAADVQICTWEREAEPSYWFYTVLTDRRDDLVRRLHDAGIESSIVHRRNDRHSYFSSSAADLPQLDSFYARMLHIPCGWWVTDEDRERIAKAIKAS